MNATTPYSLGSEHLGLLIFATVIDTTAGANQARVGAIQSVLDTNDMVKFVWPDILTAGHTYEIAMFADSGMNRMCSGAASGAEAQWLINVPAVTGDFVFNWVKPVARIASCQDFPSPVPL